MSFFSSVGSVFGAVKGLFQTVVSEVGKIINVVLHIRDYTIGVVEEAIDLIHEVEDEYDQIVHFKFVTHWKTRVVSVPRVFDNVQELIKLPGIVINAFKDLVANIRTRFTTLEAAEAVEEVIPGLGQAAGIITLIAEVLVIIKGTVDDLKTIVDAIQTFRKDIENLDAIFLPNTNPRKIEQLADGGSIKIRVGSLHKA
jgi:phage-related protein